MASTQQTTVAAMSGSTNPIPEGSYSVMIPWAETWVDEARVRKEFEDSDFGTIGKVDLVHRDQGKRPHQKIFIHFTEINADYKDHLENGNEIKVFYNGTYFWKVRKSNYVHQEKRDAPKKKVELC